MAAKKRVAKKKSTQPKKRVTPRAPMTTKVEVDAGQVVQGGKRTYRVRVHSDGHVLAKSEGEAKRVAVRFVRAQLG